MMASRKRQPRQYRSTLRAELASQTRQRVLDAAAKLFIAQGYAVTTIVAVATEAGVSPETVYASFGGKRRLLEGVIDATIMGPNSPVPLERQPVWERLAAKPTASERLRAYIEFTCGVLDRTSPIHQVIRGAADSEPFAVELSARLLRERLASNAKHLGDFVGDQLRKGLSLKRAAERYCAVTSPEVHHLTTSKLSWSSQAYREWVTQVVERDLLGDE